MEFWKTRGGANWVAEYDGDSLPSKPVTEVQLLKTWSGSSRPSKAGPLLAA